MTSILNLMSQLSTLLVSSFVKGSHETKPKECPEGSCLSTHRIIQRVTGQSMKPIHPCQQLNYGMTSTYLYDGTAVPDTLSQDQWASRVSTATKNEKKLFEKFEFFKLVVFFPVISSCPLLSNFNRDF